MKTTVSTLWTAILACFLLSGLTACSSGPERPADNSQNQPPEPVTIVQEDTKKAQSASEDASNSRRSAGQIRVKPTHPQQYTVKKGDTLWDIASLFLKDPWYWPEIWDKNPQVENPHLIFPGDILTLIYIDGQPQIVLNKQIPINKQTAEPETTKKDVQGQKHTERVIPDTRPKDLRVVKLGPTIRRDSLKAAIPTIPGDAIRQFTVKPRVVTEEELEQAAYVLASDDEHLILGQNNRVYIRGELDKERVRFSVFRPGKELIDPETDDTLGYEAVYAGEVLIQKYGDPSIGIITESEREILIGDRLLPIDKSKDVNLFFPKVPDKKITGTIMSLFDGLFGIAKFQVAVINRGTRDGLEVGHLLASMDKGDVVQDNFTLTWDDEVQLPDERTGLIMIFRTFGSVSYGLVMESTRVIHNGDVVTTPR